MLGAASVVGDGEIDGTIGGREDCEGAAGAETESRSLPGDFRASAKGRARRHNVSGKSWKTDDLEMLEAVRAVIDVPLIASGGAGTAEHFVEAARVGADAVLLAGDCVDPLGPKVVRSTVGSLFHLPVVVERDVARALDAVRAAGLQVLAADGGGDLELFDDALDLAAPSAWLLGNEAWGLPPERRAMADKVVSIPIYGRAESLNLATAAAVCLYASAQRQRAVGPAIPRPRTEASR